MIDCGEMPTEAGPWKTKRLLSFSTAAMKMTTTAGWTHSLSALEHTQRGNGECCESILRVLDQAGGTRILQRTRLIAVDALRSVSELNVLIASGSNSLF